MNIVLAPRAARDLRGIAAYIRKENPPAARAVLAAIFESINALSEHPRLGRQVSRAGVRRLPISGTNYVAYYRIAREDVLVLHVRDGRRRPYQP